MSEDDNYICTLDSASEKKAKEELFEDPRERLGAVKAFRSWINEQKWLRTPTDTGFLLQILRSRKFSQLRSRELIENYWKYRGIHKEWYRGVDPADPKVQKIWEAGVYCFLPGRDKNGRKILIARIANIDYSGKSYTADEFLRAVPLLFEASFLDENVQVNGMVMVTDLTGFTMKHQNFFGMDRSKKSLEIFEKATPARVKEMHYYNVGPVFEAVFAIIKPFMKEKLQKRVTVHGQSLMSLYEKIDMSMLPTDYLPDDYTGPNAGTMEQIAKENLKYMREPHVQDWLRKLHSPEYGYDVSLKPNDNEPQASFRKLNVS